MAENNLTYEIDKTLRDRVKHLDLENRKLVHVLDTLGYTELLNEEYLKGTGFYSSDDTIGENNE